MALFIFVSPLPDMVKFSYLYFRLSAVAWTSIMVADLLPCLACLLKEILKAITILPHRLSTGRALSYDIAVFW